MPDKFFRPRRDYKIISSAGGRMEVAMPEIPATTDTKAVPAKTRLVDVDLWVIRHRHRNVETPRSGSRGAMRRDRVASEFFFNAAMTWDAARYLDDVFNGSPASDYTVGIKLYLGDPNLYPPVTPWGDMSVPPIRDGTASGAYYAAERVRLDDLAMIVKPGTGAFIRAELSGSSDSVLERYYHTGVATKGDL